MSVVDAPERPGGLGTRRALVAATSRIEFERAVDVGDVVLLARNRYARATVDEARRAGRPRTYRPTVRGLPRRLSTGAGGSVGTSADGWD